MDMQQKSKGANLTALLGVILLLALACSSPKLGAKTSPPAVSSENPIAGQVQTGTSEPQKAPLSLANPPPLPESMADLVNKAAVIVVGTIGPVIQESTEGPYGSPLAQDPRDVPQPRSFPFSYFVLTVEEVIFTDGLWQQGVSLVLRENGRVNSLGTFANVMPMPKTGERYLFVLRRNPDQASYGHSGPWGLFNIQGPTVRYSDWERSVVNLDGRTWTPEEFKEVLRHLAQQRTQSAFQPRVS